MTTTETVLFVLLALVLLVWLSRHITLCVSGGRQFELRPGEATDLPESPPLVSIVVPARDEKENIAGCIKTLQAQDYPEIEIIVVDDRSSDGTASEVRRLAGEDERIRLVQVDELPAGWFGKPHALQRGAAEARGEWLLFVDADCRQAAGAVRVTLDWVLRHGGDMLSLWPMLELRSFSENLLEPVMGGLLGLYYRPQWVNDPQRKVAFANGQFILLRRDVFDAVDGFEAVRGELVEDIAFARLVKGRGYRALSAMGFDIFRTRMYDGFRAIWNGWTRIFSGAFQRAWYLGLVVIPLILLMSAMPWVLAVVFGIRAASAGWTDGGLNLVFAAATITIAAKLSVMVRVLRLGRANPWMVLLYPLALATMLGVLVNALLLKLGLRRVSWRGTTYHRGKAVEGAGTTAR